MAYTIAQGPPLTECTLLWTPGSGTPGPFGFNDPTVFPWIKVNDANGLRASPEATDASAPRTYGEGEIFYPARTLGKTVVYEGEARANTEADIRQYMNLMSQAFGDINTPGVMTLSPYVGGTVWTFTARVLAFTPDKTYDWQLNRTYKFSWGWQLDLRMGDPNFYTGGVGYR